MHMHLYLTLHPLPKQLCSIEYLHGHPWCPSSKEIHTTKGFLKNQASYQEVFRTLLKVRKRVI